MKATKIITKPNKVVIPDDIERMASIAVDASFAVHLEVGPGLLESAYQACFARELELRGIRHQQQLPVPLTYRGHRDGRQAVDRIEGG